MILQIPLAVEQEEDSPILGSLVATDPQGCCCYRFLMFAGLRVLIKGSGGWTYPMKSGGILLLLHSLDAAFC